MTHPDPNDPNAYVLYRYIPSLPAAIIFAALFCLLTIAHCVYLGIRRTWFFTPFIIGGIFECVGYIARGISHYDRWSLPPFIAQSILLLVAPGLFAASIYIILGRVIRSVDGAHYSPIPLRLLTRTFVIGDVISFFTQAAGGGIQSMKKINPKIGEDVIIAGLCLQVLFFSIFMVVTVTFHRRFVKSRKGGMQRDETWRKMLYALYGASGLIMLRSVFRVVEYVMGNDGYILRHEWFLYVFDGLLMLTVMVVFLVWHPSRVKEYAAVGSSDEEEMMMEGGKRRRERNSHLNFGHR